MTLLHNFVRPKNSKILENILPDESNKVVGMYINNPDDMLIFTIDAVHWLREASLRSIPHSSIEKIEELYVGVDDEVRELKVFLYEGEIILLPVVNITEDFPDIFTVYEFLNSALPSSRDWIPRWKPSDIESITTRTGLVQFLIQHDDGWGHNSHIVKALRAGYPKLGQLREYGINEQIVENADAWRLLALVLCDNFERPYSERDLDFDTSSPDDYSLLDPKKRDVQSSFGHQISDEILGSLDADVKTILAFSSDESAQAGQSTLSPEFILLGLVAHDSGQACRILRCKNLTLLGLRKEIRARVRNVPYSENRMLQLAPMSIELFIQAAIEKEKVESEQITPAHMLEAINNLRDVKMDRLLDKFDRSDPECSSD
jgi:hypothetical protein